MPGRGRSRHLAEIGFDHQGIAQHRVRARLRRSCCRGRARSCGRRCRRSRRSRARRRRRRRRRSRGIAAALRGSRLARRGSSPPSPRRAGSRSDRARARAPFRGAAAGRGSIWSDGSSHSPSNFTVCNAHAACSTAWSARLPYRAASKVFSHTVNGFHQPRESGTCAQFPGVRAGRMECRRPACRDRARRPPIGLTKPVMALNSVVLPGAVRADDADHFAAADGERDAVERNQAAEAYGQIAHVDDGLAGLAAPACGSLANAREHRRRQHRPAPQPAERLASPTMPPGNASTTAMTSTP